MTSHDLPAALGGKPAFSKPFRAYQPIGREELDAAVAVLKSGKLSGFIGAWVPEFYGGPRVRRLEERWARYFGVRHALSVNSATSGLYAAIGALGIEPGDEVIVTPTTMSATVTGIVLYQAVPVFADISPDTFCIDPAEVERLITPRTRAIIAVDIYGATADWRRLRGIARRHGLQLIEDSAQSLGGRYLGRRSGTFGDIGVFSLNRHKHIHCGEGGLCVTDDDRLAERIRLIRNHGEAVVGARGTKDIVNILGFNFRMNEVEAAISLEQLKKLEGLVRERIKISDAVRDAFRGLEGITVPEVPAGMRHVYYYLCLKLDPRKAGLSRKAFVQAMNLEGVPLREGGYEPIYYQPMYQRKIAFGRKGYPFTAPYYRGKADYRRGLCPVAERMWERELFYFPTQSSMPCAAEAARMGPAARRILRHAAAVEKRLAAHGR
ncbi:MAG TPA: pyridoxal-5'-phosphate-dependent protein [Elusimicrobia bacterium]|nr:pyridoxal-5'-phosphate-dependent protein [Elusimicrobiota bacterium]